MSLTTERISKVMEEILFHFLPVHGQYTRIEL
jgi:hypothetical protein